MVLKIAVVLIITAIAAVMIRADRPELAMALTVAGCCVALVFVLGYFASPLKEILALFEKSGLSSEYFKILVKALGISYIASFAADTCRDFGQSALAAKAEFAGKCAIFILSVPLIKNVLEAALEIAGL